MEAETPRAICLAACFDSNWFRGNETNCNVALLQIEDPNVIFRRTPNTPVCQNILCEVRSRLYLGWFPEYSSASDSAWAKYPQISLMKESGCVRSVKEMFPVWWRGLGRWLMCSERTDWIRGNEESPEGLGEVCSPGRLLFSPVSAPPLLSSVIWFLRSLKCVGWWVAGSRDD